MSLKHTRRQLMRSLSRSAITSPICVAVSGWFLKSSPNASRFSSNSSMSVRARIVAVRFSPVINAISPKNAGAARSVM